jgi:hypothetical protein
MIIGLCPYRVCDAPMMIPIAERTPSYQRHECDTCGRPIWTYHSRMTPWSVTEAEFLTRYEVDEQTKQIRPRAVSDDGSEFVRSKWS